MEIHLLVRPARCGEITLKAAIGVATTVADSRKRRPVIQYNLVRIVDEATDGRGHINFGGIYEDPWKTYTE